MSKKKAAKEKPEEKKRDDAEESAEKSEDLNEKLAEKEKEIGKLKDELLLQMADFDNARKRLERQKQDDLKYASLPLIRELLTVVDNLELAVKYAERDDPMRQGVSMALDGMKKVLEKFHLKPISARGQKFDPSLHEAMHTKHDPNEEDNIVLEEHQAGYMLYDRVVRAAGVIVNHVPAQTDDPLPKKTTPAE